ncbi:shufflon system plasmid conjugative transfer pilus tip adhesin PilV [Enterobacter vonholyi]|uniref:shufflon system plasmid conjugative transfer pilus tip adhesin PilV n=1 Tax=Enterobacter vonholyi TaxID=2797505 RepID=UPI002DB9A1C9|nr:shufflon system plasmid conjugative transfer pilus tip adhesin PilV [Enterobacter vonholyi]MEB5981805.1 shufflon system plasmid conjugative transfer pilus tip adhesin PilV [Enterobacter vonholyi]
MLHTPKRGISNVTDIGIAVGMIFLILTFFVIPISKTVIDEYRNSVAAGQALTVQNAVNKYILDNAATISATATPTVPYNLTVPMLVSAGYLPSGYSSTNNFSATYATKIFEPTTNKFHTMTFLTGGVQLSLSQARKIATRIGATGGYIESGVAKGALGAWSTSLSAFGGFNPGDGHIVIAGFYQNGAVSNDYLYRKAVPGHPELNTMNTALNMGGNDVTNAATLRGSNAAITNTATAATVNATTVNATTGNISGTLTTATAKVNGALTAGSASISGTANITGKLTGSSVIQGQYFYPSQQVVVGQSCPVDGYMGRDSTGQSVSCVNRVWAKSSGVPVGTIAIWGSTAIPAGWLECNGQAFSTTAFSELASYYPSGRVPDFRGVFLRGLDRGLGRDPDSGRGLLSIQSDEFKKHRHQLPLERVRSNPQAPQGVTGIAWGGSYQSFLTDSLSEEAGGAETRPINSAVIYIIKAQ